MVNIKNFTTETNISVSGVYMITHKDTDIKYVGSTKNTFSLRWKQHLNSLNRGFGNVVLLNILKKYGIKGFSFSILEILDSSDIKFIRERERFWIEYYDTFKNGANCTLDTTCAFTGFKRSPYSEEMKLKYMNNSPTKKTVYLYDKEGTLLYIFPSSCACDRFLGIEKRRTNWAINHFPQSLCGKYYPSHIQKEWNPAQLIYDIKCESMKKVAEKRKLEGSYNVTELQKQKIRLNNPKSKRVALYDLEDNLVKEFNSLNECDDFLQLYRGTTSKVFRGLTKVLRKKYIPKLI